MTQSKLVATTVGCPFGAFGPGAVEPLPLPVLMVGSLTGGSGGSITPSSARMGLGASAGGKSCFAIIATRLPGKTGDMYSGILS